MKIESIPADFTPHTDDSSRHGYPPDVEHETRVDVVIAYDGDLYLSEGRAAQGFGWAIEPAAPSAQGLSSVCAPIVAYRVLP